LNALSGYAGGLPKATARVDSRLKLTFGQLVSKSTHHVRQVDDLIDWCMVRVRVKVMVKS